MRDKNDDHDQMSARPREREREREREKTERRRESVNALTRVEVHVDIYETLNIKTPTFPRTKSLTYSTKSVFIFTCSRRGRKRHRFPRCSRRRFHPPRRRHYYYSGEGEDFYYCRRIR